MIESDESCKMDKCWGGEPLQRRKLIKRLEEAGWRLLRNGSNHDIIQMERIWSQFQDITKSMNDSQDIFWKNISYGGEGNEKYIPSHYTKRKKISSSYVPDFDISTQGENITNVIEMTRDAIAMTGLCYEDQNIPFPIPTPLEDIVCKKV